MSSDDRPYLSTDDLAMLERVLAQANFPRSVDALKAEARREAARQIIEKLQRGETSEMRLRETLSELNRIDEYPGVAESYDLAISITASDMTTVLPGVKYGYGKRVEADKSRTIYHAFTGVPVNIECRDLVQLEAKTATGHFET